MTSSQSFRKVSIYSELWEASKRSRQHLLREESYKKGEHFVALGKIPTKVGLVSRRVFSQNHISESGEITIKYFFPDERFVASVGAMLPATPSAFEIVALENT